MSGLVLILQEPNVLSVVEGLMPKKLCGLLVSLLEASHRCNFKFAPQLDLSSQAPSILADRMNA